MHAVILDIDGTLLRSFDVDGRLYAAAVRKVHGHVRIRDSWGDYRNVTDSGILREIYTDNDITPDRELGRAVEHYFVESIERHIDEHGPFSEVPGARAFVASLVASNDHAVAYATGGWSKSALLKLSSAEFPVEMIPLASSDQHVERTAIMQRALDQLGNNFETITYYGDGQWDKAASACLGWRFVAVGEDLGGITSFAPLIARMS